MAAPPPGSLREVIGDPAVRVAVGVTVIVMLGFGLIVPTLPLFARSFGVGRTEVGLLNAAFGVARLITDLGAGPMVGRLGERHSATLGTVVVGVSSALSAVAPSFGFLVLFRSLGGAGSSLLFVALMSYLLRSVDPGRMARAMSLFVSSFLLGTVLGQPIGGLIAEWFGLAAPLWFYAGACGISALLMLRYLTGAGGRASPPPPTDTADEVLAESEGPVAAGWRRARKLLRSRPFVTALVANGVMFWLLASVRLTLVPLFAGEEAHLSEFGIGVVLGAAAVGQFAVVGWAGRVADRRGRKTALVPGLAGLLVTVAVMGWAVEPWLLAATLVAMGLSTGFAAVVPAAVVADVTPGRSSASAVGVFRFAGDVGFVLGPAITGLAADVLGFRGAFLLAALPLAGVLALALRMPETLARHS
ncbi:MAG: MFS transporter [Actinomycetota bacterium]